MKILKNNLKNEHNLRTQKDYPKEGIEFIDITPLILQKETIKEKPCGKIFVDISF